MLPYLIFMEALKRRKVGKKVEYRVGRSLVSLESRLLALLIDRLFNESNCSPSLQRLVQTIFTLQFFIIKFAAVSFQKSRKKFMKTQAEEAAIHMYMPLCIVVFFVTQFRNFFS